MSITLVAVGNPKWLTVKNFKYDANGNIEKDESGNDIVETLLDESGNPVKIIECECQWSHLGDSSQEWLSFAATASDTTAHGKALYDDLIAGKHGTIADES